MRKYKSQEIKEFVSKPFLMRRFWENTAMLNDSMIMSNKQKFILVTGRVGFIGCNLFAILLQHALKGKNIDEFYPAISA